MRLRVARSVSRVSEIGLRVMRVGIRALRCGFVLILRVMHVACHACRTSVHGNMLACHACRMPCVSGPDAVRCMSVSSSCVFAFISFVRVFAVHVLMAH